MAHETNGGATLGKTKDDYGFTLMELMVVILVIAIILAIAIPTFLGATKKGKDTQAKSNLRTVLVHAKTYYASDGTYGYLQNIAPGAEFEQFAAEEPSMDFHYEDNPSSDQSSRPNDIQVQMARVWPDGEVSWRSPINPSEPPDDEIYTKAYGFGAAARGSDRRCFAIRQIDHIPSAATGLHLDTVGQPALDPYGTYATNYAMGEDVQYCTFWNMMSGGDTGWRDNPSDGW